MHCVFLSPHLHTNLYRLIYDRHYSKVNIELQNKNTIVISIAAVAVAGLMVTLFASGALLTSRTLKTTGILASANLGIYSDSACTQSISSVSLGTLAPGTSTSKTFYVKNIGSVPIVLSMSKTNWNPTTANGPVAVNWNRQGATLSANQVVSSTLTITVSYSASGFSTFSFDVVITGTA